MNVGGKIIKFHRPKKKRPRKHNSVLWGRLGAIAFAAIAVILVSTEFAPQTLFADSTRGVSSIDKCRPGQPNTPDKTCVVDGDTIWLDGVNIRMQGYDTPEPQSNICGGERERALADQASDRLVELLNTRSWEVLLSGEQGSYGREIGTILVEGRDVGEILVEERLARWWPNGEEWWCE